ncbi:MFS transporter [Candidatus Aerophobetes bacterium]|uniref:MFS transporter n=1 Tax=Aerophobetes bacterium TaxID=2030807 RepID=A0A2A4X1R2_UNCAE|nr:MAG: MFS transporter [Candidatus Aerophobetes bacterium]
MAITSKEAKALLNDMLLARAVDLKMQKMVRQNKGGTFHLYAAGHEMVGCMAARALIPGKDWAFPYYRDRAFALTLGCSLTDLFAAFMARDCGHHSSGRMMPEHYSHKGLRIPCQSSVVGSQFLQAVGLAKGISLAGEDEVVYVSAGEGSTSQGDFHEALNFSALHKLGVVFVIQDNGWAISVPSHEQTCSGSAAKMVSGYKGLNVIEADGCDCVEMGMAVKMAVRRARNKEGPTLIVAKVPRLGPHSSSDDPKKYQTDAYRQEEEEKDPIVRFKNLCVENSYLRQEQIDALELEIEKKVQQASEVAEKLPVQDASEADTHVYKEHTPAVVEREDLRSEPVVIMDALNHALSESMEQDSEVVVFGQDVARGKGGVFGITRTLTDQFGENRIFNTPLAESTIVGLAIGMSFKGGFKPVVEIQFADYFWTSVNQMFNELSSMHYRSNGEWHCPVVIRMPYGGYIQGGPYHSQSIEAFLCHVPGLKVVVPSRASDAKLLLKAAINDPNPVIFLEHKAIYRQRVFCADAEPCKEESVELGKARLVRSGKDITVISWGYMVSLCFEVATSLQEEGIDVEIIDLRTLNPLDEQAIIESAKKTGKLMIVQEAPVMGSYASEIAARVQEPLFEYLDAPIRKIGSKNCPVPYAKHLEEAVLPQKSDIKEAMRKLASY